jgi:hypothetical protein
VLSRYNLLSSTRAYCIEMAHIESDFRTMPWRPLKRSEVPQRCESVPIATKAQVGKEIRRLRNGYSLVSVDLARSSCFKVFSVFSIEGVGVSFDALPW